MRLELALMKGMLHAAISARVEWGVRLGRLRKAAAGFGGRMRRWRRMARPVRCRGSPTSQF